jgi:ribose 5-phosphate isomerase B
MKIFLGSDHNGFHLRNKLKVYLTKAGYDVVVDGELTLDPADDFPIFAQKVVKDVLAAGPDARGVLICGSGQGMCMAANRFKGIRALVGYDLQSVKSARNDDDANILCLPADVLKADTANLLVEVFLNTPFAAAPRFIRRIREIDEYQG